ncbi:MAG: amino acid adenylation domain-containing protein, partial [bacterium]|nr:amino acid adenylation domain-containing protein [bacterium]
MKDKLIDHILVFENFPVQANIEEAGRESEVEFEVTAVDMFEQTNYDFTLAVVPSPNELTVQTGYNAAVYEPAFIDRLLKHLETIILQTAANPDIETTTIDMLSAEEKRQLLYEFNATQQEYTRTKTIHQLFEEQAAQIPDQISIVGSRQSTPSTLSTLSTPSTLSTQSFPSTPLQESTGLQLTNRELNKKSNQLAAILQKKGVQTGDIVGIMLERSIEVIIGILAILKAGGAYLPIAPDYPEERINYILKDSNAKLLIKELKELKEEKELHELHELNELGKGIETIHPTASPLPPTTSIIQPPSFPNNQYPITNLPPSLAYIIYKSGSTRKPKGVMVEHRNVVRLVKQTGYIEYTTGDSLLMTGTIVFDVTTFEIWGTLLNGVKLCIAEKDDILDAGKLAKKLSRNKITILHLIPQLFNQMAEQNTGLFANLRYLLVGGDLVAPQWVNRIRKNHKQLKIRHMYGPTENTTFSTYLPVERNYENRIPIGKPLPNSTVYILDKQGELLPIGVPGEISVGGDGVARGYLNNPELTAEKFVTDNQAFPNNQSPIPDNQLYRTGDLGMWQPDGTIEFLGRMDNQVKIRGIRIETGEIENAMQRIENIKEAVIQARKDGEDNNYLIAWYLQKTGQTEPLSITRLRENLTEKLPPYMIPSYFVTMESMPLTPNGKIDRKALPEPGATTQAAKEYRAPANETEKKLAAIWQDLLEMKPIGTTHNFFEIGGHSLKAITLIARINKTFQVHLPITQLFENPFIKEQARYIERARTTSFEAIDRVDKKDYYPVSAAQKRMYALNRFAPGSVNYNMPGALFIEGNLSKAQLEKTLRKLISRHESLRTSFHFDDGEPQQRIHEKIEFTMKYSQLPGANREREQGVDSTAKTDEGVFSKLPQTTINALFSSFLRPFELTWAPLLRAELIKMEEMKHILVYDMHHIISDGVSMEIFIKEFAMLFTGQELKPLSLQYKDYAAWQKGFMESEKLSQQKKYWQEKFSGKIPVLAMPTDYPRPALQRFEGETITFEIDEKLTGRLYAIKKTHNTTLYIILLALYNILLSKYSGREDIIVGTPSAGRRHTDLEKIIGMFVNTLAMRNAPQPGKTFLEFLKQVKQNSLEAFENQDYQFDHLLEYLEIKRDTARNPLFDTMFSLQRLENTNNPKEEIKGLTFSPLKLENKISKFDITLHITEKENRLYPSLEYSVKLFKKETMTRFTTHFINIIEELVTNPNQTLARINMLSEAEEKQLLYEFNDTQADYPKDKTIHQLFEE